MKENRNFDAEVFIKNANSSFLDLLKIVAFIFNIDESKLSLGTKTLAIEDMVANEGMLLSATSNKESRSNYLGSSEKSITQMYWIKFSAVMKEIIAIKSADNLDVDDIFFQKLGCCRFLIDRFIAFANEREFPDYSRFKMIMESYLSQPHFGYGSVFGIIRAGKKSQSNELQPEYEKEMLREILYKQKDEYFSKNIFNQVSDLIKNTYVEYGVKISLDFMVPRSGLIRKVTLHTNKEPNREHIIPILEKILNSTYSFGLEGYSYTFFLHCEKSGSYYLTLQTCLDQPSSIKYSKYYIDGNVAFILGSINGNSEEMECGHTCKYPLALPTLIIKFNQFLEFINTKPDKAVFFEKLGELCFLYINIMPYRGGSAAIGEWLMGGFCKRLGIELSAFNHDQLSWDFTAFVDKSAEEYGKKFKDFFAGIDLINTIAAANASSASSAVSAASFFEEPLTGRLQETKAAADVPLPQKK